LQQLGGAVEVARVGFRLAEVRQGRSEREAAAGLAGDGDAGLEQ